MKRRRRKRKRKKREKRRKKRRKRQQQQQQQQQLAGHFQGGWAVIRQFHDSPWGPVDVVPSWILQVIPYCFKPQSHVRLVLFLGHKFIKRSTEVNNWYWDLTSDGSEPRLSHLIYPPSTNKQLQDIHQLQKAPSGLGKPQRAFMAFLCAVDAMG